MINKFNISKPEKYIKDGVEKTYWANVGTYTEFEKQDGTVSRLVEIPAIGLKANLFPVEPKTAPVQKAPARSVVKQTPKEELDIEYPDEEINPDDIPF